MFSNRWHRFWSDITSPLCVLQWNYTPCLYKYICSKKWTWNQVKTHTKCLLAYFHLVLYEYYLFRLSFCFHFPSMYWCDPHLVTNMSGGSSQAIPMFISSIRMKRIINKRLSYSKSSAHDRTVLFTLQIDQWRLIIQMKTGNIFEEKKNNFFSFFFLFFFVG